MEVQRPLHAFRKCIKLILKTLILVNTEQIRLRTKLCLKNLSENLASQSNLQKEQNSRILKHTNSEKISSSHLSAADSRMQTHNLLF